MADANPAAELQDLQRQLQLADRHLASLEQNLAELQSAITTLDGLDGDSALDGRIPIGAGVRVAATVDPTAPVMMEIGAGYTLEAPAAEALVKLRERLKDVEDAFRATSRQAEAISQRMQQLQMELPSS